MRFNCLFPTLLLAVTVSAQASSQDPSAVLASFWPTAAPTVTGTVLTSLASELSSAQASWSNVPAYASLNAAIFAAAPSAAQASLKTGTWIYGAIATQAWYAGVPDTAKQILVAQNRALATVAAKYLGPAETVATAVTATPAATTASSSRAGALRPTVVAVAAVGLLGVMGVMVAL